jgi:acetyltransferase-like isoleucine patch superfamily enzyme
VIAFHGDTARCTIGSFCSIAPEVQIQVGGNHHMHTVSTFPFRLRWRLPDALADGMPSSKGDVTVGNDVWIGQGAMILSGVTIGDGAVIGARAVVAADVRPYAVVVGSPAREVRRRFSDEVVHELLAIRWWDWPDDLLKERIDYLNKLPVEAFIERFRAGGNPSP